MLILDTNSENLYDGNWCPKDDFHKEKIKSYFEFTLKLRVTVIKSDIFVTVQPIPNEVPWAEMGLTFPQAFEHIGSICNILINRTNLLPKFNIQLMNK